MMCAEDATVQATVEDKPVKGRKYGAFVEQICALLDALNEKTDYKSDEKRDKVTKRFIEIFSLPSEHKIDHLDEYIREPLDVCKSRQVSHVESITLILLQLC